MPECHFQSSLGDAASVPAVIAAGDWIPRDAASLIIRASAEYARNLFIAQCGRAGPGASI